MPDETANTEVAAPAPAPEAPITPSPAPVDPANDPSATPAPTTEAPENEGLDSDTGLPKVEVAAPEVAAPTLPIILGNAEAFVKKFELGLVNDIKEAIDHIKAFLSHHGA